MKRILIALLLFSYMASSAQKIDRKVYYDYSEDVEFRIYWLSKKRTIERGTDIIIAKKGRRFISIVFQFRNKSSKSQIIDFEKIFLKDKNSKLHNIDLAAMTMKLSFSANNLQHKLKPNKKRKIIADFRPSFDKNEIIKTLIIGDKIIELEYKTKDTPYLWDGNKNF